MTLKTKSYGQPVATSRKEAPFGPNDNNPTPNWSRPLQSDVSLTDITSCYQAIVLYLPDTTYLNEVKINYFKLNRLKESPTPFSRSCMMKNSRPRNCQKGNGVLVIALYVRTNQSRCGIRLYPQYHHQQLCWFNPFEPIRWDFFKHGHEIKAISLLSELIFSSSARN